MKKPALVSMAMAALLLGLVTPVTAGPVLAGVWYEFAFFGVGVPSTGCFPADPGGPLCTPSSGTPTTFADAPAWTFVAPGLATLIVTDAFLYGDAFDVFDFGGPIGATPPVAVGGSCGDDPILCSTDLLASHSVFPLAAGAHSITITPYSSPFGDGAAYFKWDSFPGHVPEPATSTLLFLGFVALASGRGRRRTR